MRILAEEGYRKPVIALTAHAMKEEKDFALSSGFFDYLTKPIDRSLLISTLEKIRLRNNNSSREPV